MAKQNSCQHHPIRKTEPSNEGGTQRIWTCVKCGKKSKNLEDFKEGGVL